METPAEHALQFRWGQLRHSYEESKIGHLPRSRFFCCAMTSALALPWLILGVVCIATSAIFPKLAGVPGASSAFWRFTITFAVMLTIQYVRTHQRAKAKQSSSPALDWRTQKVLLAAGAVFGLDMVLWNEAILRIGSAEAMILGNMAPLWVGLLSWWILGKRPRAVFWLACVLAIAGLAIFVGVHTLGGGKSMAGVVLSVSAGWCYASYLLLAQQARRNVDVITFLMASSAASAIFCLVFALLTDAPLWSFPPIIWLWLALSGLITGVLGWWTVTVALGSIPATTVSLALMATVPVAALMAWPIFGETITLLQVVGTAVLLVAITISVRSTSVA